MTALSKIILAMDDKRKKDLEEVMRKEAHRGRRPIDFEERRKRAERLNTGKVLFEGQQLRPKLLYVNLLDEKTGNTTSAAVDAKGQFSFSTIPVSHLRLSLVSWKVHDAGNKK